MPRCQWQSLIASLYFNVMAQAPRLSYSAIESEAAASGPLIDSAVYFNMQGVRIDFTAHSFETSYQYSK